MQMISNSFRSHILCLLVSTDAETLGVVQVVDGVVEIGITDVILQV
jgi:hypothetical protein